MRLLLALIFCCSFALISAQTTINFNEDNSNKLYIKLYAHIDYNQPLVSNERAVGKLDVHRLVTLFGYQFNRKTQFVSEIEFEHVSELFVEQAFVKHRLTRSINLKAGLLLVPMGLVNEMHEPTFFYSVERPLLDKIIVPSTWREIGFGISGLIQQKSLKYQLYLMNSPISYSDGSTIQASTGIRGARQKGAKSIISTYPGLSGQIEYFGFAGIKLGLSAFIGKTNSSKVNELKADLSEQATLTIDSTTVDFRMLSYHATFDRAGLTARFQYSLANFGRADSYNQFNSTDIPTLMHGYYFLLAYDFLSNKELTLAPFLRVSQLNNSLKETEDFENHKGFKQNIYSLGINYKPNPSVVFKFDYQIIKKDNQQNFNQLNAGVGVWF